jgi:hypothetical protein
MVMVIPFLILNVDGNLVQTSLMVNKTRKIVASLVSSSLKPTIWSFSKTFQLFFLVLEEHANN